MKKNSWKTLLSVLLLLAMLVSMLPFAAFAEDGQTAAAQTEEAAKTDEKTGDAPEGGTGGTPKDEGKADDAPKDEPNDANDDAARDENKDAHNGDTEQPAKGEAEGAAQAGTLQAQNEIKPLANPSATLIYNANGGTGADYIYEKSGESGAAEVIFKADRIERFTPPKDKEFSHWNTDPDGKGTTYNVGDPIIVRGGESQTLYAQWVDAAPKTVDITLTYDANGGTGTYSETKTFNVGEPYTFTVKSRSETGIDRAKHAFSHWSVDKDDEWDRYYEGNTITVTGDTTLYAQWQYVPQKISVLYYSNNPMDPPEVDSNITEGTSYTVRMYTSFNPPYNKHFVNWNTEPDGSGTTYEVGQEITAPGDNLILCAQWADNPKWSELGIAISAPARALPGADLTYAITVTNGTGYDLNSVTVDVALPAEVTYDESLSSSGAWSLSYNSAARVVTARLESDDGSDVLALNGTAELNLPVTVTPAVFGTIEAKAKIAGASSRTGGKTGEGSSAAAQTTMAGLEISVSAAPTAPTLREEITYTVTVKNNTGLTLSGIRVNNGMNSYDSLSMLSLQASSSDGWDLTSTGEGNLCDFHKDLAPGDSSSYQLTTSFINADNKTAVCTATITSLSVGSGTVSGSFGSASATVALKEFDWSKLTIEKKVDKDTALPGEKLNYTITVTNNTGCDLSYICVEDTFPSCIQGFYGTGSNVKWKYTTHSDSIEAKLQDGLKAGTNAFFSVEVTLTSNASGTAVNKAEITEATAANSTYGTMPEGAGNSATATTSIERAPGSDLPGLTISVTPNTSIADINQKFTYTVEITNNTGKHLKIVRVSNDLPTGVERLGNRAVEGSWNLNTNSSTAILSANLIGNKGLPDGTSASYNVNAKFVSYETATTATNKADIYEVRIGNDITSGNFGTAYAEVYSLKNLTIKKTVDKSTAKPGDTLTYTVEVTNNTDTDLDEVYVEDSLPGTLAYTGSTLVDGATGTLSHDSQLGTVTAKVTGLKKGAAAKYTVTAKVNADASGEISSLAKITKAVRGTDTADITTTKEASAKTTVYTPVPVNVKVLFNGLEDVSQVPAGYKLTGADGNAFLKGEIGLLPAAKDNGVISRTFATTADVLLGQEYSLSFTQSGYEADGYDCTPEASYTVRQTPTAGSKAINVEITLNYTKAEPKPVEMDAAVTVKFVGLDKDTKLPAGYALIGAPSNEFLSGAITLTKDETADTMTYTGKISALPGKTYDLRFMQSGYNVDGYKCNAAAAVSKTVTADAKDGVDVTITLTYTKEAPTPVEMDATVTVKFVGLDKDTKLPAGYTLTGDKANEFLRGTVRLTPNDEAKTMVYTGKISALPGKTYDLKFMQSGFEAFGYICDAGAVVTKTVTADAKSGVAVELVLNYTKINWGGLTITKTANKTHAAPGSYVKYTITVTNNTGVDMTDVNVLDYLPSTVRYSSSFGGYDSGTGSWTIAKLADGKSATTTIRVKLNSGLSTGTAIENTAYVTGVTINGQEHVFENLLLNSTAKVIVTDGKGAPQTGDESNLGLWGAVMAASLVCAGAAAVIYKKRRG